MVKILVVDDDPDVCETLDLMLSSDGHDVVAVNDGDAALELAKMRTIDLAIVDILMPVKEGIETIQDMQKFNPETRIIAMSGGSQIRGADFLSMATKLGADVALRKPVGMEELRKAISDCLGQPQGPKSV